MPKDEDSVLLEEDQGLSGSIVQEQGSQSEQKKRHKKHKDKKRKKKKDKKDKKRAEK